MSSEERARGLLDCAHHALGSLVQDDVVEMSVAVGSGGAPMAEQPSRHVQALTVADRVRGMRMLQIVKPHIRR